MAWDLVRLVRPLNGLLAAFGVLAGMLLSIDPMVPPCPPGSGLDCAAARPGLAFPAGWAAPLAAFLVTSFGNALNDVRDVAVDRHAHPGRPLPSGAVGLRTVWRLASILLSAGLAAAAVAGLWTLLFAAGTVALLVAYEWTLKRRGLAGNAAVALLTASTFAFGAVAQGTLHAARLAFVAAAMAFLASLGREVVKDVEDVDADRLDRRTLPMVVGSRNAGILAAAAALLSIFASWPFVLPAPDRSMAAAGLVAAADATVALGAAWCVGHAGRAQRILKAAMALALAGFLAQGARLP